jgi:MFS family permease
MRRVRAEHLLPLACAAACAMLAASEFMDTFELNGPGPALQAVQPASDQHHYALLVLAGFALVALAFAVLAGSKPAATAVAVCGAGALLIFLLIDLPDAGKVGTIEGFTQAKAEPATGFWLQLAGALVLAICGGALATLSPEQLRAFARPTRGPGRPARPVSEPVGSNPGNEGGPENERPRKPSRSGDAAESAKRAH